MCQRGEANGAKCSRGVFCAFAHSYDDSRKTSSSYRGNNNNNSNNNITNSITNASNVDKSAPPPYVAAPSSGNKAVGKSFANGLSPGIVTKKCIIPETLLVVTPVVAVVPVTAVASVSSVTPVALVTTLGPTVTPVTVGAVSTIIATPPPVIGQIARRRGPTEPPSNQSLELTHYPPPDMTPEKSFNGFFSETPETNTFIELSPSPSLSEYLRSPSSSASPLAPQLTPLDQMHSAQVTRMPGESSFSAVSTPLTGPEQRIIRRRGPSGPVDSHFLGLLSSPSSPPTVVDQIDVDLAERSTNAALQGQITSLKSDLIARDAVLERRDIELRSVLHRLKESHDLTSSMCATNDSMALEIQRLRADLANTQLLLCRKDEDLSLTSSLLKERERERERERSLSPLSMLIKNNQGANNAFSAVTNGFPELLNMRAMLSSVESDFDSRLIKMTFKI